MKCLIWRQHRGQALWAALALAVPCALMLGTALSASHWFDGYHQRLTALAAAGCPAPDGPRGALPRSRWAWFCSIRRALAGEAVLGFALAVAIGAWLRRSLPAIGGALACFLALLLGTGWMGRTLTPAGHTTGPALTVPAGGWVV